jgi:plastocyanin
MAIDERVALDLDRDAVVWHSRLAVSISISKYWLDAMKIRIYRFAFLGSCALLLAFVGCGSHVKNEAPEAPAPPVNLATAASITGTVIFDGTPPVLRPIDMSASPACAEANQKSVAPSAVVRGANGGLADVVVYVKSGLGHYLYPRPQTPVILDQKNCMYVPHVLALMVGQPFEVANSDPTLHNVLVMSRHNPRWSSSQPVGSAPVKSTFEGPEFAIPVLCDIHPWMRAYVFVFDQPYFVVTSEDGAFALKNLPPGTYTIEAWHEPNTTLDQTITLAPRESKPTSFTFHANAQS